jgi:hypothetical protein
MRGTVKITDISFGKKSHNVLFIETNLVAREIIEQVIAELSQLLNHYMSYYQDQSKSKWHRISCIEAVTSHPQNFLYYSSLLLTISLLIHLSPVPGQAI